MEWMDDGHVLLQGVEGGEGLGLGEAVVARAVHEQLRRGEAVDEPGRVPPAWRQQARASISAGPSVKGDAHLSATARPASVHGGPPKSWLNCRGRRGEQASAGRGKGTLRTKKSSSVEKPL